MRRLLAAMKLDLIYQFRSGFHAVYVFLSLVYIVVVNQLPYEWGNVIIPFVILSDPAVLGFFFVGGLMMLEKVQGIVDFVHITPLRKGEFLLSKVLTLNILALVASFAISIFTGRQFNPLVLIIAVLATASFFTMMGFLIALTSRSMNHYFGRVIPAMILIILPCFSLIGFPYSELFYIVPSVASAKLIILAFSQVKVLDALICGVVMLIWNYLMYRVVTNRFDAYTLIGGGVND